MSALTRRQLVIDRKVWLRGTGMGQLLTSDGRQCCVGIYLSALGMASEHLRPWGGAAMVHKQEYPLPEEALWLITEDKAVQRLYKSNDYPPLSEPERELEVANEFAKHGVDVEFIN